MLKIEKGGERGEWCLKRKNTGKLAHSWVKCPYIDSEMVFILLIVWHVLEHRHIFVLLS